MIICSFLREEKGKELKYQEGVMEDSGRLIVWSREGKKECVWCCDEIERGEETKRGLE